MDYIVLSIPIFFILIGVELLIARLRHTKLYRFNDALTNISCGITQQVIGVLSKTVLIIGYIYIHEHWRLLDMKENIWTLVFLFIGIDFFYYWFHRYAHEVSLFWGTHIVHHQSEEYNLSVALRQSSLQGFVSVAFYFPLAWIGFNPISFVAISAFQTLYQFWIHTQVIDKLPGWFEYVFNTPSHHRVHHGRNPKYIDKNHGGTLIIWDRLFGTFQLEEEEVIYGVTKPLSSWNPVWANLDWYVDLWSDLRQPMHWKDRLRLLFNKPGWLPANLAGSRQVSLVDVQSVPKYDTEIPLGLNHYILSQYVFILVGTSAFLFNIDLFSVLERWIASSLVILSVLVIGGFFELRRWAFFLEWLRWSLLLLSLYYFLSKGLIMDSLFFGIMALGVLSLVWFTNYASRFSKKKMIR